ncbi:chloride channel protein [Acidicapsa dinghuensis]|uniref:Chloride channel protein n=1 Tax=Acidicapsa dinghuensis TaxID=2218256 RepID=A0ABW1EE55_9BACT|nr:chloride channel protein [Acidicapsa dinghuensis]
MARHVFLVAAPFGVIVGAAIAGYDFVVNELLWKTCTEHLSEFALCFLPIVAMLLTGIIMSLFRVKSSSMADEVVRAYHRPDQQMEYKAALPKLTASVATMGFGASAGMEGASKWLGGTITSYLQRKINSSPRLQFLRAKSEITLMVGAAAGIAAIFRAPLTGAIMGIESPYKHDLAHEALIPGLVASATSYATFSFLRPATPYFPIEFTYHIHIRDLLLCLPVGILGGLASHLFLALLARMKKRYSRWTAPRVVKNLLGGILLCCIALLTLHVVHSPATLQAGLPVANALLNGKYVLWACLFLFAVKLVATVITFGMGGVGGLFVPSATIGAALGAACDAMFHPSQPGLFTLIGIAAFTGASYNSLLFAAVFVAEATGSPALVVPGLIASSAAFLVAAGISNSEAQREHRITDEGKLSTMPCSKWMTRRIVVASPTETLAHFHDRAVLEHTFDELPVVAKDGTYLGIAAMKSLRMVPQEKWASLPVTSIIDRQARTVCAYHSMKIVEQELAHGSHDYVPVVDPATDHLIGILSARDVLRARMRVDDAARARQAALPKAGLQTIINTKETQ